MRALRFIKELGWFLFYISAWGLFLIGSIFLGPLLLGRLGCREKR